MKNKNRIWIFQADKVLDQGMASDLDARVQLFLTQWQSHGHKLKSRGGLVDRLFIIIEVDTQYNEPGGCSQDSLVHFIRSLGAEFGINFFDRHSIAIHQSGDVSLVKLSDLKALKTQGKISADTLFYNSLLDNADDFETSWPAPIGKSWPNRWLE